MIQLIKNQSVSLIKNGENFNTYNERITQDNREFCQILHTGQTVQFQMYATEDSGTNLVGNGKFTTNLNTWTLGGHNQWSWNAGKAYSFAIFGTAPNFTCDIYQSVALQPNKTYKLKYSVEWVATGGEIVTLFNVLDSATVIGGESVIQSSTHADGDYEVIWRTGTVTTSNLTFTAIHTSTGVQARIDNIELYELTEPIVTVKDCEDNHLDDINTFTRWGQYITATYQVTGFDEGQCLKFCFEDSEDGAFNFLACNFALLDHSGRALQDENGGCLKLIN